MSFVSENKTFYTIAAAAVLAVGIGAALGGSAKGRKKPAKEEETWESHVDEKHGDLEEIYPGVLYRLEAPGCEMGPPLRNMTIYRVPSSEKDRPHRLVIISAIAVREDTLQEILALGTPTVMVVPNHMHRCCAGVWKRRFPNLTVVCVGAKHPADSRKKIEDAVPVDMTTEELAAQPEWKDYIAVKRIEGWVHFEEIIEVKLDAAKNKKAMIVCDLLFTMIFPDHPGRIERAILWFFDSCVEKPASPSEMMIPKVSRVARIFGIRDWNKAEAWYRNYALEDGKNIYAILVAHGPPVVELDASKGCTEALVGVADQLVKPRW